MQRRNFVTALTVVLAGGMSNSAQVLAQGTAPPDKPIPSTYRLSLVLIADTRPSEFILVLNTLGYKSLSAPSLRAFVAGLPAGSTIEWEPGCRRTGGEPTEKELAAFRTFAKAKGIHFVVIPAG